MLDKFSVNIMTQEYYERAPYTVTATVMVSCSGRETITQMTAATNNRPTSVQLHRMQYNITVLVPRQRL